MNHHCTTAIQTANARAGMTLLEIMIALMLLIALYGMTFELMITAKTVESTSYAKDELQIAGERIGRQVGLDTALSAWHVPTPLTGKSYDATTQASDRTDHYYFPYVLQQDTGGVATDAGLSQKMPWANRSVEYTRLSIPDADARLLPGSIGDDLRNFDDSEETAYQQSFLARSQEMLFVRTMVSSWVTESDATGTYTKDQSAWQTQDIRTLLPSLQDLPRLRFPGSTSDWSTANNHAAIGVLRASGWTQTVDGSGQITGYAEITPNQPYGVVLDSAWYDRLATGEAGDYAIKSQFETVENPTYSAADYGTPSDPMNSPLREYTYAVVPTSPRFGLGRLVRAYKVDITVPGNDTLAYGVDVGNLLQPKDPILAGKWRMRVDLALSDDVVRITFDTYRTTSDTDLLDVNQVRMRVFLARKQTASENLMLTSVVETTLSMRARGSSGELAAVQDTLGTTAVGLPH